MYLMMFSMMYRTLLLAAALVNFNYIANGVLNTTEAINAMGTDPVEVAAAVERVRSVPKSVPNGASNYATQWYLLGGYIMSVFGAVM